MGKPHHDICAGCPERLRLRSAANQIANREATIARIDEQRAALKEQPFIKWLGSLGRRLSLHSRAEQLRDEIDAVQDMVGGDLCSSDVTDCTGLLERYTDGITLSDGETLYVRDTLCGVRAKLDGIPPSEIQEEGWQPANPEPAPVRLDLPRDY